MLTFLDGSSDDDDEEDDSTFLVFCKGKKR